jgi:hypothetical protein
MGLKQICSVTFTATALTVLGVAGLNVLPSQAQSEVDTVRPKCNQRSNGRWICVFGVSGELTGSPYKSYEGTIANGIPNGEGVMVYENDDRYEGQVSRGVPNGQGMFVFANNSRYEGGVRKGKPDGTGVFTFANGDKYSGGMLAGQPHGNGTFSFAPGDSYTGQFYLGQAKGYGVFKSAQGIRCEGRFFSSQLSGDGSCSYPRGFGVASYVGEFRKGQPAGRGRIVYRNGNTFAGQFRDGRPVHTKNLGGANSGGGR